MARILLVDDDIAEISAVKRVLARGGHQSVLSTNGRDALGAIAGKRADLVVVSSSCAGGEALRALAGDAAASALPTIVLGEPSEGPPGATAVPRPVDAQQLAEGIAAALAAAPPGPPAPEPPPPPVPGKAGPARRPAATVAGARTPAPTDATSAAGASRKAAADALRARAEELRRKPAAKAAPPGEPSSLDPPAAAAGPGAGIDDGLEAILRRAEEAERKHAAEKKVRERLADRTVVEAAQRAEAEKFVVDRTARAKAAEKRARDEGSARAAAEERARLEAAAREKEGRARAEAERRARDGERARADAESRAQEEERARAEAEKRARDEERARADAEPRARQEERARTEAEKRAQERERARVEAEKRAQEEERARAEAEKRAQEEERARADAEKRARQEERARADAEKRAREEARRAQAEAAAGAEARRSAEGELERLRKQLDDERRGSEAKLQSVMERARAEERASEELRRIADDEAKQRAADETRKREEEDEKLRKAIESARAEMDELRRRTDDEARRRAEAEAELARLAREAERRAAEAAAMPPPFDLPVYQPPADEPAADPSEDAARRRAAAMRERPSLTPSSMPSLTPVPMPSLTPVPSPEPFPGQGEPGAQRRATRAAPPELRGGTVAEMPVPRLIALAARAELTGRLDFEGGVTRSLWFEGGRIVGASSADPSERVEELALRLGLVTRDQHRQIAQTASTLGSRRAALLLLERGFLKPTELTSLVRRRTEEVAFGIFAEAGARFRFAPEEVPQDERTALERSPLALAVEGVRRRWRAPQVDAVLGGAGTLLSPVATGPTAADLALSAEERRAVALADGLRTLDEIVAASPLDALSTRQILSALVLVGSLAVRTFQGGRPASVAATAIDLARVRDKLDQVRRADYFTILGIGRLSTPYEIREAADRLLAEFDPRRYVAVREDGLESRLSEIQRVVGDARDVLSDDRLREEYLLGLGD